MTTDQTVSKEKGVMVVRLVVVGDFVAVYIYTYMARKTSSSYLK
jgi:hypothetical protein